MFLDFLRLPGDLQNQAKEFLRNAKANPKWIQDNLIQFISFQNESAKRGEISVSTIPNYYRGTKLFCEMNDVVLVWKKIALSLYLSRSLLRLLDSSIFLSYIMFFYYGVFLLELRSYTASCLQVRVVYCIIESLILLILHKSELVSKIPQT